MKSDLQKQHIGNPYMRAPSLKSAPSGKSVPAHLRLAAAFDRVTANLAQGHSCRLIRAYGEWLLEACSSVAHRSLAVCSRVPVLPISRSITSTFTADELTRLITYASKKKPGLNHTRTSNKHIFIGRKQGSVDTTARTEISIGHGKTSPI